MAVTYSVNFSLNSEYPMTSRQEKGWLCSEYCEHDIFTEDGTFFAFLEVRIFNVKKYSNKLSMKALVEKDISMKNKKKR